MTDLGSRFDIDSALVRKNGSYGEPDRLPDETLRKRELAVPLLAW